MQAELTKIQYQVPLTSRRQLLAGSLATCVVVDRSALASVKTADAGLDTLAKKNGHYFGSAAQFKYIHYEDDFRITLLKECSVVTPELALKWSAIEPERGKLILSPMDDLAAFALMNNLKVRGHVLLWHKSTPGWVSELLSSNKDWGPIQMYFGSTIPRYGSVIRDWDVVNEPIETGHSADGLRPNDFLKAFGPTYIDRALDDARMFAPEARLFLNEFSLDYDTPVEHDRRYCFLKLIERLRKSGRPLDGIGLQGHLDLGKGPFSQKVFSEFLRELAAFNLKIVISELDVKEYEYVLSATERDQKVADAVKSYLDVALANPAVEGVVTWGLSDRHSWLKVEPSDYARNPNAWLSGDGPGFNRGLPFDSSMRSKPMYRAIAAAYLRCSMEEL